MTLGKSILLTYLTATTLISLYSISCRLPQTPRTPSTGMAHYFDDIFTRHSARPNRTPSRPQVRRSSTARSIGARSDFDPSVNGDEDAVGEGDHLEEPNSVGPETAEREREREEADAHTANYVSERLSRVRSRSVDFERGDEFEAQLDEDSRERS